MLLCSACLVTHQPTDATASRCSPSTSVRPTPDRLRRWHSTVGGPHQAAACTARARCSAVQCRAMLQGIISNQAQLSSYNGPGKHIQEVLNLLMQAKKQTFSLCGASTDVPQHACMSWPGTVQANEGAAAPCYNRHVMRHTNTTHEAASAAGTADRQLQAVWWGDGMWRHSRKRQSRGCWCTTTHTRNLPIVWQQLPLQVRAPPTQPRQPASHSPNHGCLQPQQCCQC